MQYKCEYVMRGVAGTRIKIAPTVRDLIAALRRDGYPIFWGDEYEIYLWDGIAKEGDAYYIGTSGVIVKGESRTTDYTSW